MTLKYTTKIISIRNGSISLQYRSIHTNELDDSRISINLKDNKKYEIYKQLSPNKYISFITDSSLGLRDLTLIKKKLYRPYQQINITTEILKK